MRMNTKVTLLLISMSIIVLADTGNDFDFSSPDYRCKKSISIMKRHILRAEDRAYKRWTFTKII